MWTCRLALPWALVVLLAGCDGGDEPAVPFGLDGPGLNLGEDPDEPRTDDPEPPERTEDRALPPSEAVPPGTARLSVEGAPVEVPGDFVRVLLHDLDGDGDRDVLALAREEDTALQVLHFVRDGAAFQPSRLLGAAPLPTGCEVRGGAFEAIADDWIVVRAATACPDAPSLASVELWVLSREGLPRRLEHFGILAEGGRAPGGVALRFTGEDVDEDGRTDLLVRVTVGEGDGEVLLPWLDRPSGLTRDDDEPEATLASLARTGLTALSSSPVRAEALSRRALGIYDALCRGPGRARLRLGRTAGIDCGSSEGAGRAAATLLRAVAGRGEIQEALALRARIAAEPGLRMTEARREAVAEAIANAPSARGITLTRGPTHRRPTWGEAPRLSALGFLDDNRLLLRGDRASVYVLDEAREEAAAPEDPASLAIEDPSGRYAVAALEGACAGVRVRFVSARAIVHGHVAGALRPEEAWLTRVEPPADEPCEARARAGVSLLGWAPQGLVGARDDSLWVAPLDASARPVDDPRPLPTGSPPPAPLSPGAVDRTGTYRVTVEDGGLVVRDTRGGARLWWPEGWGAIEEPPTEVAISSSGRRVAALCGDRVWLLSRGGDD